MTPGLANSAYMTRYYLQLFIRLLSISEVSVCTTEGFLNLCLLGNFARFFCFVLFCFCRLQVLFSGPAFCLG